MVEKSGVWADGVGLVMVDGGLEMVVERCLEKVSFVAKPSYNDYVETNRETRARAKELIDLKI